MPFRARDEPPVIGGSVCYTTVSSFQVYYYPRSRVIKIDKPVPDRPLRE